MLANFDAVIELPGLFQFGTTRTDDVETAGVTIFVDDVTRQFLVLAVDETGRTAEETVQFVIRVERFEAIIKAGDNIVTTGGLSAGEDDAYVKRLCAMVLACGGFW